LGALDRISGKSRTSSGFLAGLFDQAVDCGRGLRTHTHPIAQAVMGNAQGFFSAFGNGVVKPNALDETAIATHALVSHNNVEKWTGFRAAAGESDDDHGLSFGWWNFFNV